MTIRNRLRRCYRSAFGLSRHDRRLLAAITSARPCAGCQWLLAAPGDTYCGGCRSALERGDDPAEWPAVT